MGQDGYMKMAKILMETTEKLKEGINKIPVGHLYISLKFSLARSCMQTVNWRVKIQFNNSGEIKIKIVESESTHKPDKGPSMKLKVSLKVGF